MRISIVGWYGKGNVGDEAFCCIFKDWFMGHDVEFVTPPKRCNNPDIVILGGGAVASPFYLNILPDCPRYALGIDIAYESEIDLLAPKNFKAVLVRNTTDIETMRAKLNCPVEAIPDLAFAIPRVRYDALKTHKRHITKPTLGVFATDYVNPAIDRPWQDFAERSYHFKTELATQLDMLSKDYEIMLIPCSTGGYGDDRRINLDIKAFMKHEPTVVMSEFYPHEMVDLVARLDFALCQRFHAHIFSAMVGTPFLSFGSTRKVQLFLKEHNCDQLLVGYFKGNKFNLMPLKEKIAETLQSGVSQRLAEVASEYRCRLGEIKTLVRRDWLGESL
jgi:polysaccharide pyruvyl transferase WcaK-like protein